MREPEKCCIARKIPAAASRLAPRSECEREARAVLGWARWRDVKASLRSSMTSVDADFGVEIFGWVTFVPRYDARASSFFS